MTISSNQPVSNFTQPNKTANFLTDRGLRWTQMSGVYTPRRSSARGYVAGAHRSGVECVKSLFY